MYSSLYYASTKETNHTKINRVATSRKWSKLEGGNICYNKVKQIVSELTHIVIFSHDLHLVNW